MRFHISLSLNGKNKFLPVNYQYYISSWIYKRIAEADKEFAEFLHGEGYGEGNKRFKFFNFSPLQLRPYHFHKNRGVFELLGEQVGIQVSFFLPEIAKPFIRGLFLDNEVFIGDRINGVTLQVKEVQAISYPEFTTSMTYRLASPCCVTRPPRDDENYAKYLSPKEKEYIPRLIENLKTKYSIAANIPSVAGDSVDECIDVAIKILTDLPKSKLVTIKEFTEKETKIRGWLFDCIVKAPANIQEFIWDVGLGEKGSLGFGMVNKKII